MNPTDTAVPPPPSSPSPCPRCGTLLPSTAGGGAQCPVCLFDVALAPPTAPAPGPALPPITELQPLFPDHELQALLGRGGMGAVYRARHKKLDRLVAIKVLLPDLVQDPAFAERFEGEARALARLDHPGIVGLHDFGRAGPWFYLVMDFVDGANLRELLAQGQLRPGEVLRLVAQLCDALQYAHDHRIVHRDIKPENLLVDGDGRVRIADFGLAKLLGPGHSAVPLTQTNQSLGTPLYMAPEQMHAPSQVDHRADLYSLGVVVYEMLTGRLPLGRFQPPSARDASASAFDPVVMKSLESDPAQRYQAAREVKRDLQQNSDAAARRDTAEAPAHPALVRRDDAPRPQLPWVALVVLALVTAAQWMPWLITPDMSAVHPISPWVVFEIVAARLGRAQVGNAWDCTIHGMPLWLTLVAALVATTTIVLRDRGMPALGPVVPLAQAAGLALCLLTGATSFFTGGMSAGIGHYLAMTAFAGALGHELWRRRRAV